MPLGWILFLLYFWAIRTAVVAVSMGCLVDDYIQREMEYEEARAIDTSTRRKGTGVTIRSHVLFKDC